MSVVLSLERPLESHLRSGLQEPALPAYMTFDLVSADLWSLREAAPVSGSGVEQGVSKLYTKIYQDLGHSLD